MSVSVYLGIALSGETQLQDAFRTLADKHSSNPEVKDACERFGQWCQGHIVGLQRESKRLGAANSVDPERVRGALFHGVRVGGLGLLRDLHDLSLLVQQVYASYLTLIQAAKALRDSELLDAVTTYCSETDEQAKWVETQIKVGAAQALTVPPNMADAVKASLPKRPSTPALPDAVWAPLASGMLMLVVGLIGWGVGRPWLFPALGPTAYLQGEMPANPVARWYNTVVGHLVGLLAGFAAIAITQAHGPAVLTSHVLTLDRVFAAAIALALTMLVCLLLKASHPPAGATTLLVALGAFRTFDDAMNVMAGAVIIALAGEAIRLLRLKGSRSPRTLDPADKTFDPARMKGVSLR